MRKIAVVDIEATGPNFEKGDRMIQIAAVIYQEGQILGQHNMYINPEITIPQHIQQLTGISQEVVEKAPTFKQVASLWYERLKDCVIIAHNLAFDLVMLQESFMWANQIDFQPIALDTVKLAKILVPWADGFNLTQLAQYYQIPYTDAHDAASDAFLTMQLLSKLADEVLSLDKQTFQKMMPYIRQLPNDEQALFINPKEFRITTDINREVMIVNQVPKDAADFSLLSQLIVENMQRTDIRIIFEKMNPSIKNTELIEVISQIALTKSIVVGVESMNSLNWFSDQLSGLKRHREVVVIKKPKEFIHLAAFEELLVEKEVDTLNQQEIISIAATIRWLKQTKTGDYAEIREELVVQSLLEKYCRSTLVNQTNFYYQALLKRTKTADVILIETQMLSKALLERENYLKKRSILILNYEDWIEKERYLQQKKLPVSQLFTELQSVFDYYVYQASIQAGDSDIASLLNQLIDAVYQLLDILKHYVLKEKAVFSSVNRVESYLSPADVRELSIDHTLDVISSIAFDIQKKLKQSTMTTDYRLQQLMQLILDFKWLENGVYSLVKAQSTNQFIHDIELISRPLFIENPFVQHPQQEVYLFSRRFYDYKQKTGSYQWLKQNDFTPIKLPNQLEQSLTIEVPLAYMNEEGGMGDGVEDNQDLPLDQVSAIKQQIDFINDQKNKLNRRVLVIVPNQQAKELTYQMLKQSSSLMNQFGVLCPGIHGSLKRVLRRQDEMENSILILTSANVFSQQLDFSEIKRSILIQRLPFVNPKIPLLNAIANYYHFDSHLEFDQLHLPLMQSRLNDLLLQLAINSEYDKVYLFDDRIYTKYYSYQLRNNLNPWLNFSISDD
ncbi:exonuclease domain-containing protein [Fundicoccus culcitae]|uniref:Exonuclease domain-containing protein n=1 Tax=Fundicoccus culcitae TaxID=2969821 RepID=A0ABY5P786_9LACT|nr:exonuclease domain-containing protein [Fundicoccus culcitae]UUX34534.1 exonuclease domain-containing protein [Fundicoccus culcitae]